MSSAVVSFPKMPIEHGIAIPKPKATQHQKLQKQAQRFVAQTFYGTLLKQMRESPFRDPRFDGGRGGQAFNEMLDAHLSERMAGGTNNQLVHSIAQKLDLQRARDGSGHFIREPYRHHAKAARTAADPHPEPLPRRERGPEGISLPRAETGAEGSSLQKAKPGSAVGAMIDVTGA
jgi:Rod binding domain-containing protein